MPTSLKNAYLLLMLCTATAIPSAAQTFTSLFSFDGTDGGEPSAGLIQATDGNFYGTSEFGGNDNAGTVFKISSDGTLTTLYSFCSLVSCADGDFPRAGLIQATDGNFYGTTSGGGAGEVGREGTVFKITPEGTLTTLYSFCNVTRCADGEFLYAGLIQASDGNFYGTTQNGGAHASGTVFRITSDGTLTTLYSFCSLANCSDGASPWAGLIQASDGNFYGTTYAGAAHNWGTVFKITPGGTLTTLYSFCRLANCSDGAGPKAGLIQASDGSFYGTTLYGGMTNGGLDLGFGTIFKITPEGTLTTLYPLYDQHGQWPYAGLIQAADGNLYGTTSSGGTKYGTVFEITPEGTLATLHSFDNAGGGYPLDGGYPYGGLVQANDGRFYGTTSGGGAKNQGTIFSLAAVPEVTLAPSSLSFGNQALGETSTAKPVTLKNSGTALLIISGVAISGSAFAISANACSGKTLGLGKICKISVTFTPAALGKVPGTLTFTDNASNSPQKVSLSGTGVEPATLKPASAIYASQAVGTTSLPKTFTLTNNQDIALTSIAISTTGDFAASATTCTASLAAKSKCTISVTFTPTATGTRTGTLSVSDSASNSPQAANLKGTGK